jgi:hypothetical protein
MMTIPGFTAEASFRTFRAGFQARTEADVSGGLVHPAGSVFIPTPDYCLTKLECWALPFWPWLTCSQTGFGIWNPVTHRCE